MDINFPINQSHACLSKKISPNLSQGSVDAKYFKTFGRSSNIQLNGNIYQDNPLHRNTITHRIKQQYPPNTITKGKTDSWAPTMLVDSGSVATIINTELFE